MMKRREIFEIAKSPENYTIAQVRSAYLKLGNAALRAVPSSPWQKELKAMETKLRPLWISSGGYDSIGKY